MSKRYVKKAIPSGTDPTLKDLWATPQWVVEGLRKFAIDEGLIRDREYTLDVCANEYNAKCPYYIDEEMDTLAVEWGDDQLCWLNPPYSNVKPFLEKAFAEKGNRNETIALLKNDCSTKWFKYVVEHANAIIFITEGRISFVSAADNQPIGNNNFSSMVVIFSEDEAQGKPKTLYLPLSLLEQLGGEDE